MKQNKGVGTPTFNILKIRITLMLILGKVTVF